MPATEISYRQLAGMDAARLAPLVSADSSRAADDPRRPTPAGDEDDAQFLSVGKLRTQYLDYLTSKVDEIEEQKTARHYYHGAHWTPDQIRILRGRHQPPMTWNRVARKINSITGLIQRQRSDPKALPNSPKSEAGAEIATETIRYVLGANAWKEIDPWCLLQCGIDGIAGVQLVLTQGDMSQGGAGDPDIALPWVIGDEYFYDPKSYRIDFADKRYEGIAKWIDVDEAIDLFPDKADLLKGLIEGDSDLTTNADREYKWVITASRRIRLVEHWYRHKGRWCWAFYVSTILIEQGVSPFHDEKGKSASSFVMFSHAVDHDGDRYGFVRNLQGPQDSLNQGKSKMLHLANTKQVRLEKGAVDDVETMRREVARPDGVVETNPGRTWEIVDTKQDLAAFSGFAVDAKAELDGFANSNIAAMTGVGGVGQLSGRALELLRQPGMSELGFFILSYRGWKVRVYRAIWNAAQRYWTKERWIRVSGDDRLAQFIQLNGLGLDQFGRPAIVNALGALDVDIDMDEGADIATIMEEAYDTLKGYPPGTFPPQVLIEINPNIPRKQKDRILGMMAPKPPQPGSPQEMAARLQIEGAAADVALKGANVRRTHAAAEQALATAAEKHAKVGTEAARAGHLAHSAHLDASEFARDTLFEAHKIAQQFMQPQQGGAPQPAPQQNPQQGGLIHGR